MIDVLIADDQNFVRKTLESYLALESDLNVVGFAEDGASAIDQVEALKPDVVLMDIEMPVMNGLTATKTISEKFADTKVLILSVHDKEEDVARALKLGAKGYWLKDTTPEELADAIRYVHKGYFQVALKLVEKHYNQTVLSDSKTAQEQELSNKLSMVDKVLAQVDRRIHSLDELSPQSLSETIENIVRQEVSLRNDQDVNLQFRLDRLRHQFDRLEQNSNLAFKIQLFFNVIIVFFIIGILSYLLFST